MRILKPLAAAITLIVTGAEAFAQGPMLEEVIVTATKRAQSLQDVPVTVTAFSSETIQEAGINNASDVAILTPSLTINGSLSPFNANMKIRGLGTAQTDPALEPSVGLFVDGVFLSRSGLGMSDLTDVERIEILQGPQGTLYGKNTNAGAISVITKKPNLEEYEGFVEATAGDYSMTRLTAMASGPITDSLAFRLSANTHQRDGYLDNASGDDLNKADDWNVQGKVLWEPTDSLSILLSGAHVERDNKCCGPDALQNDSVNDALEAQGYARDKNDPYDYDIAVDVDSRFDMDSDLLSMTLDYDMDWASIKSITAWNDYDYTTDTDVDRSQLDIMRIQGDQYSGDAFSQELRLTSELGSNIDYQLGLFYYDGTTERGDGSPFVFIGDDFVAVASQQNLPLPAPIGFLAAPGDYTIARNKWDTETLAIFSQATWHMTDSWHLTGGLRYTDEEKKAELFTENVSTAPSAAILGRSFLDSVVAPVDADFKRTSDNVDWLLKLAWDVAEATMVFASASTGSKSGGFNGVNGAEDEREFDDEDTSNYELGVKSTLLDSRLRVNATAFYTQVDDYQFQQQQESGLGTIVGNDAEVEVSGLDLQVDAMPLPMLTLSAGLLYMHKYEITDGPKEGDDLSFTSDYSGNLAATVVLPLWDGGVYFRTDYSFMDDHATSAASAADLQSRDFDDRELLNMKLGWRNDNWNVSVWGKNLTDDEYAAQTVVTFLITGMDGFFLAPPRTYGATIRYDF